MAQNPLLTRIGHLVVKKAVTITIIKGMDAMRVRNPNKRKVAQSISNVPVK